MAQENKPLLFVEGIAIFIDKISAIDFNDAMPENPQRHLTVMLDNNTKIEVKDPIGMEVCIDAFIPERLKAKYKSSIQIVRK
jgi:hypothetical protein